MASIAQTQGTQQGGQSVSAGVLFGAAFLGGAVAAVVNVVLFFGAQAAGVSLEAKWPPEFVLAKMMVGPVIFASIVPAIPAAIVALVLTRVASQKAALLFGIISAVLTVLSFGSPLTVEGLSTGDARGGRGRHRRGDLSRAVEGLTRASPPDEFAHAALQLVDCACWFKRAMMASAPASRTFPSHKAGSASPPRAARSLVTSG